jgi:hypothetical protein
MKKENTRLKKELAICLNKSLIKEIKSALKRIEKGKFVGEEEFFKQSPLKETNHEK